MAIYAICANGVIYIYDIYGATTFTLFVISSNNSDKIIIIIELFYK